MTMAICPECNEENRFRPMGPFRMQCGGCGAVVKNEEVTNTDDQEDNPA